MANDGRKKPRSVMATDSDWRAIRSRAGRAEMTASEYLVGRGLAPAEPAAAVVADLPLAVKRRAAVDLRILVLSERLRFEAEGRGGVWLWRDNLGESRASIRMRFPAAAAC